MENPKIKAHFRMEERYEGLQLVYGLNDEKQTILDAIEKVKNQTGLNPDIFENNDPKHPEKRAIYLEFHDDYDREGGEFFEEILKILHVEKCN
ncbi:MAG: hypothetical protein OIF32_08470 [Campylobacterales bacterium]|nr:hypothetical protein [Campylobacterales bacterium]